MREGLLDTSVFIARESGRPVDTEGLPDEWVISVVTVGELHAGVYIAPTIEEKARRIETLAELGEVDVLPIDERISLLWARMRVTLVETGRRADVNDIWIAATAAAYGMPVVTQDTDFDALDGIAGLEVVRV